MRRVIPVGTGVTRFCLVQAEFEGLAFGRVSSRSRLETSNSDMQFFSSRAPGLHRIAGLTALLFLAQPYVDGAVEKPAEARADRSAEIESAKALIARVVPGH